MTVDAHGSYNNVGSQCHSINNVAVLLFVLVCFGTSTQAEQIGTVDQWTQVKESNKYHWGEGVGKNVEEAKTAASADLIKKIWVEISVETDSKTTETTQNGEMDLTGEWSENIASYSSLSLTGLEHLVQKEDKHVRALAYITSQNLRASLIKRKSEILDYIGRAIAADRSNDIGNALQDYYRAFLLSHTYPDTLMLDFDGIASSNPRIAIAGRIRSVLSELDISSMEIYRDRDAIIVDLLVKRAGSPVGSLNINYYSGLATDYASVKDGHLTLPLYDEPTYPQRDIDLHVDYVGASELARDPELWQIHEHLATGQFSNTVTVRVSFPWLTGKQPGGDSAAEEVTLVFPNAIQVLSNIQGRDDFLRILDQFKRLHSIDIGKIARTPSGQASYVAIIDSVSMWGLFYLDDKKYREVSSGRELGTLSNEFAGKHQIWIYCEPPQEMKKRGNQ